MDPPLTLELDITKAGEACVTPPGGSPFIPQKEVGRASEPPCALAPA